MKGEGREERRKKGRLGYGRGETERQYTCKYMYGWGREVAGEREGEEREGTVHVPLSPEYP